MSITMTSGRDSWASRNTSCPVEASATTSIPGIDDSNAPIPRRTTKRVVRDARAEGGEGTEKRGVQATRTPDNRPAAPAGTRELSGHLPGPPGNYPGKLPVHPGKMPMSPGTSCREHGHTGLTG